MKKRKTYEISVIDKTYSKIISDETKFYTSDTALELVFKLKETEYTFESAEIVLLNIDDRSLVTRPVVKVLDSFAYELDDDITAHYGEWHGQLRFEAGETYVSSPVKFRIENDLSNDRPPQLSDVQSWVSLKRYADDLIDELKQAVLEVEAMDDTFNANELERQATFETAEQSRQTTFETNESERDETFNTNENIRQTQELEREGAETTRQQAEGQRKLTFEANESERQSAEQQRVEAEKQRNETVKNIEARQSSVENQFISVQEELTDKDVISAPEIIAARGGEPSLSARLDKEHHEVTAQLAQTVKKGNVSVTDINKNLGKFDQTYMSEEFLQQMAGNTPINAIPADKSITSWKLTSNSVTPKATNFIEQSSNLINPNDLIEGYSIISSSGELDVNNNYYATKFIEVEKGLSYSTGGFNRVAYYSESKGFVGYASLTFGGSTFDVPENAYFVRLHGTKANLDNFQMNEGATLLPKENYFTALTDEVKISEKAFREHKVSKEQLPEKIIESKHVDFLKPSTNLYLYNPDLRGIALSLATGEEYIHENYTSSDFIEVVQGAKYTYSEKVSHIHYYDSNKKKIGSTIYNTSDPQVITSVAEGVFVRIQFNHKISSWEDIQINLGDELLAYDKGGETLDKNIRINAKSIEGMEDVFNHDWVTDYPLIVDTDFEKEFNCPDLVDMGSTSTDPLNDYKTQDFYVLYDQLVANYPDYVTRTFLGNDASGTIPIYRYDFRPKEVITSSMAEGNLQLTKFPKVILTSGSHPEKTAAWCLYESMKQITTRWNEDESLEDLRWNVHFIVIPFFNPWGYDNGKRYNYNEVNIGRNFPHKFVVTAPGMTTWGGTNPLSEPETQYLYNVLMENQDALCHIDFHNMGHTNNFIWIQPVSDFGLAVAKALIRQMTRKWKKERELDAPSDLYNGYVGYTNRADHGTNLTFAETLGMRSATFEVTLYDLWHPERPSYTSQNLTLGTEAFVNYVTMMLKETIKEKNAGL